MYTEMQQHVTQTYAKQCGTEHLQTCPTNPQVANFRDVRPIMNYNYTRNITCH